ncbi:MAG: hypothetical protein FGM40_05800 [Rhodocyclaceae bacterium]|nr:hypothetical protein [Rhodocyclaceae bacterium]
MPRLRDGLLPALILSLLLMQYAAVGHVLAHLGLGHHGVWAGAPLVDDEDPGQQPGGCGAPQLHAVIDGVPFVSAPAVPLLEARASAQTAFLLAVVDRATPEPLGRWPPPPL